MRIIDSSEDYRATPTFEKAVARELLRNKSNLDIYEDARTANGMLKDFTTVSFIDRQVTLIVGIIVSIGGHIDVFWDPAGNCFDSVTKNRFYPGDLQL